MDQEEEEEKGDGSYPHATGGGVGAQSRSQSIGSFLCDLPQAARQQIETKEGLGGEGVIRGEGAG